MPQIKNRDDTSPDKFAIWQIRIMMAFAVKHGRNFPSLLTTNTKPVGELYCRSAHERIGAPLAACAISSCDLPKRELAPKLTLELAKLL